MASDDPRLTVTLHVRLAWWVAPLVRIFCLGAELAFRLGMLDEERIDALGDRVGSFVLKHGLRFFSDGRRV